jgi:hypothetical protein
MRPRKFGGSVPKNQPLSESDWHESEPRPATDLLAVLGVGSAVVAFLLWAWPEYYEPGNFSRSLFLKRSAIQPSLCSSCWRPSC